MKNVLIVFGGMTPEHDFSCKSAAMIVKNINRNKFTPVVVGITGDGRWLYTESSPDEIFSCTEWETSDSNRKALLDLDNGSHKLIVFEPDGSITQKDIDVVFARIAGNTGEDGKLQGVFEIAGIPYVGCGVMASACSMDKITSYLFADSIGIRCPMTQVVMRDDFFKDKDAMIGSVTEDIVLRAGFPIFVKPVDTGSSIGISKVHSRKELIEALEKAFSYGEKVVLEENITGSEIKVGLLGNDDPQVGAICEIIPDGDWNDFDAKYIAHSSTKNIPAHLPPEIEEMIRKEAVRLYKGFGLSGFSRIDFFLKADGGVVFNEINSMPGFQPNSVYPEIFKASGVGYTDLITRLLEYAME